MLGVGRARSSDHDSEGQRRGCWPSAQAGTLGGPRLLAPHVCLSIDRDTPDPSGSGLMTTGTQHHLGIYKFKKKPVYGSMVLKFCKCEQPPLPRELQGRFHDLREAFGTDRR